MPVSQSSKDGRAHPASTSLVRLLSALLGAAGEHGVGRADLIRAAGISEDRLRDPDARIPLAWAAAVWRELAKRNPDPALGVRLGITRKLRELGLVGYAMLHSSTLLGAVERLAHFGRILVDRAEFPLTRLPNGDARITLDGDPRHDALHQPIDYRLAWFVAATREATRAPVVPVEVGFPYPAAFATPEHARVFGSNLVFGAARPSVVLSASDLALPLANAERELAGYLDQLAERTLASLMPGAASASDQVRRAIWSQTGGSTPTLQTVARTLGIGARSLQRRLGGEGTSFAALLDELRHALAVPLLREREASIQEIAFFLGYSDPSAFHRAFRRWEGTAPKQFRERAARPLDPAS